MVEVEKLLESKIHFKKDIKPHSDEELENHPRLKKKKCIRSYNSEVKKFPNDFQKKCKMAHY